MAEVKVPELAESITEGTISNWLKKPGETVSKGEAILELETDKVNVDIISDYDGVLKETLFAEGDTVNVGDTIAIVDEGASAPVEPAQSDEAPSVPEQSPKTAAPQEKNQEPVTVQSTAKSPAASNIIASPAARKLAREKGIDLSQVPTV
ncbi:MAG: E3 binding domain-containing protein, partial [Bacillus sp. (in: Bacteria)]|nr:E3 binding domain-containing protein [Bacillus sp. (in: firmicutes)]